MNLSMLIFQWEIAAQKNKPEEPNLRAQLLNTLRNVGPVLYKGKTVYTVNGENISRLNVTDADYVTEQQYKATGQFES